MIVVMKPGASQKQIDHIIERIEVNKAGCRCRLCGGRNDDPAGIHGRR